MKTVIFVVLQGMYSRCLPYFVPGFNREVAPFISVLIIVAGLLAMVFCKMELRRVGYSILQLARVERQIRDGERLQMVQLAKITRPERLQAVAEHRFTLRKPGFGQIIQMTEQGVAFRE